MYRYCVVFRIADATLNGKTSDYRRSSILKASSSEAGFYWDEPTSFILASSDLDTPTYAKRLSASLSASHDLLLVFDPSDMSAAYFGNFAGADILASFFTFLRKIS